MRALFLAGLLAALTWAVPPDTARTGSGHCRRCHEPQARQWQNRGAGESCESCHGPGRFHVLAPTRHNILRPAPKGYSHGPDTAAVLRADTLTLDLFVMSRCPYAVAALKTLLPLFPVWGERIRFNLYFIAHRRGEKPSPAAAPATDELPLPSDRCEGSGAELDGTDRFVSLHGLPEVLEDIRQAVIAARLPRLLAPYLSARIQDLDGDWTVAARAARFTDAEIKSVSVLSDSRYGDSLFEANIAEAGRRKVNGSPTLFVNGREYSGAIGPYPVESHFCALSARTGPCRDFPACAADFDCRKPGMEGACLNPMTPQAKCAFTPAAAFTVTVVNDEACPLCHTGNIVFEIRRRFPAARFEYLDIHSEKGRALIRDLGLTAYPAFILGAGAEKSPAFRALRPTFRKVKGRLVLENFVVKTFHFLNRPEEKRRLDLFGSFENPPFVEMIRDLQPLLMDSLPGVRVAVHPFALRRKDKAAAAAFADSFESPYGPDEVRAGINQRCVLSKYPLKRALEYMVCRGRAVEERFEEHLPEPRNEWRACALSGGLDTAAIAACATGPEGRRLFEESVKRGEEIELRDPGPHVLVNNRFRIQGFNPHVRRAALRTLTDTAAQ